MYGPLNVKLVLPVSI